MEKFSADQVKWDIFQLETTAFSYGLDSVVLALRFAGLILADEKLLDPQMKHKKATALRAIRRLNDALDNGHS